MIELVYADFIINAIGIGGIITIGVMMWMSWKDDKPIDRRVFS